MNPLSIGAVNFHRYPDLHIDLPDGCTAIVGPNGAGKSSLLEAIDAALFGGRDHVTIGETHGSVTLTFEHRGDTYRVRRAWKNGRPTLDLEVEHDDAIEIDDEGEAVGLERVEPYWTSLTRENMSATQDAIVELLGISRDTLRASAILMQNDGAAFTAAKPARRKELLCDALGLDIWASFQARAREELRAATTDLAVAQAAADRLTQEVQGRAQLEHDIDETNRHTAEEQALLDTAENTLTIVAERYQAAREQAGRRDALEIQLRAAIDDLRRLTHLDTRATNADVQAGVARDQLAALPPAAETERLEQRVAELRAAVDAHAEARRAHEVAVAERDRVERERARLLDRARESLTLADDVDAKAATLAAAADATCQTCGQSLPDDARGRAVQSYRDEAAAHRLAAQRVILEETQLPKPDVPAPPEGEPPTDALDTASAELRAVQAAAATRATLEERIVGLERVVGERPASQLLTQAGQTVAERTAELDQLEPVNLAAIAAEGSEARATVERHRTGVGHAREQLASLRTRLDLVASQEAELAAVTATIGDVQRRIDSRKRAEKAYGPAGIPALILENAAIPQIETRANAIMQQLGWSYTVRLDTQRELKSSDGVRESLDIIIETDLGEQTWERCSGGEQQRVNLALRLAVAELIATRRGVEVKLLAIDEPDGLDTDGFQALVDLLADLEQRGIFSKILVVSHHPELRTAFEQVIEVTGGGKTGSPSRIVARVEAAVAA